MLFNEILIQSTWKLSAFCKKETNIKFQNDYSNFALKVQMLRHSLPSKHWVAWTVQRVDNASNGWARRWVNDTKKNWPWNSYHNSVCPCTRTDLDNHFDQACRQFESVKIRSKKWPQQNRLWKWAKENTRLNIATAGWTVHSIDQHSFSNSCNFPDDYKIPARTYPLKSKMIH